MKAKKISHDRLKKTIYYEHATLKFYNIPIFYFPIFFHPDPTVKRQSGFLAPFFTNSTSLGMGFAQPYYWAINKDKDLTFTPKIYARENILLLNPDTIILKDAIPQLLKKISIPLNVGRLGIRWPRIPLEIGEHFITVDLSMYSDKSFPKIPLYWKLAVLREIY